jgi:hypothetical protein
MEEEIWKKIWGFGDYEVSNLGRIRSLKRKVPLLMKTQNNGNGYYNVTFWMKNKPFCRSVHRLIADVFLGPCPMGREVSHINEDKSDNRVCNLCYETHKENVQSPLRHERISRNLPLSKSGFRGVNSRSNSRYEAQIGYKRTFLGSFRTAKEAALAFDRAAIKLYGEHAITNKKLGLL